MKIKKIFEGIDSVHFYNTNQNIEIQDITDDSRDVKAGSLFVAKKGDKFDGKNFIKKALNKGAEAVVCKDFVDNVPLIKVKNIDEFERKALNNFYENVGHEIKYIGVTGTKGKTTTSYLIYNYLLNKNFPVCYIGTLGIFDKKKNKKRNLLTTPKIYDLYRILYNFYKDAHEYCVLEVSSHSIDQKRINGIVFDIAGFTNLSHDHLDYHKNMENYFETKKKLFDRKRCKKAVVNVDDKYGNKLAKVLTVPTIGFGQVNGEVTFKFKKKKKDGFRIFLNNSKLIDTNLEGIFNIYNSVIAGIIVQNLGIEKQKYKFSVCNIPGRMELIKKNGIDIYIDYAHSPASLESVLEELFHKKKNNIITVFGCTGDRDKKKRPIMGKIAEKYSDYVIITSDDPHTEDPEEISLDIEKGMEKSNNYSIEIDREKAIKISLNKAKRNDIVLIAGKGHENYQIFNGYEIEFNDKEVVLNYFNNRED